jgi:inhibitor of cysteine peptidase
MQDVRTIRLKEQGPVRVAIAQEVQIEVDENPSTGYRWELHTEPPDGVEILNSSFQRQSDRVGAVGLRLWTIRLRRVGEVQLRAELRRSWEAGNAPVETVSLALIAE